MFREGTGVPSAACWCDRRGAPMSMYYLPWHRSNGILARSLAPVRDRSGPDCFRNYEMLLGGTIVMVQDTYSLNRIMENLPVFFFGKPFGASQGGVAFVWERGSEGCMFSARGGPWATACRWMMWRQLQAYDDERHADIHFRMECGVVVMHGLVERAQGGAHAAPSNPSRLRLP